MLYQAFNYEWQDTSDSNSKVIVVNRKSTKGQLYIGVKGDSRDPADVEVDVYNDLFPGNEQKTINIHEKDSVAEPTKVLFTPPAPAFVDGIKKTPLRYSLTGEKGEHLNTVAANGKAFPFAVDALTGTVTTKRALLHGEKSVWTLDLRANAVTGKCVRGFIKLTIVVAPITTTTLTTITSTRTTVTTTTSRNLAPGDFGSTDQLDAGSCRLYRYVCPYMKSSAYVVVDTTVGTNTITLVGPPREKFSAVSASKSTTSSVGRTVVLYDPGYEFDVLEISICSPTEGPSKYTIRMLMDGFEGDGVLRIPSKPCPGAKPSRTCPAGGANYDVASGPVVYKVAVSEPYLLEDFTVTLENLGSNTEFLAYDAARQAIVYTGSPSTQMLVADATFDVVVRHSWRCITV